MRDIEKVIDESRSARFASLLYRAKGTGELARHQLVMGVDLYKAYRRDIRVLAAKLRFLDGIDKIAAEELLASLKESLQKGIGNNSQYTRRNTETNRSNKGEIQVDIAVAMDGNIRLRGLVIGKTVLEKGECKQVKSSEKTIAKNKLRKLLKSGKIRTFSIDRANFMEMKMNGKILEVEG